MAGMDTVTKEKRSEIMSRIRSRDTQPELIVRKRIFAAGWRFRLCDKRFPGRPDVVVPRAHALIEIRGCFWHQHGCAKCSTPKSNSAFWTAKWEKNISRDKRHEAEWEALGWNVLIVWECALEPVRREETLQAVCLALDFWAAEQAEAKNSKGPLPEKRPHRLVLPR